MSYSSMPPETVTPAARGGEPVAITVYGPLSRSQKAYAPTPPVVAVAATSAAASTDRVRGRGVEQLSQEDQGCHAPHAPAPHLYRRSATTTSCR